ncbi:Dnaj protein-like protein [Thalictrum thalictroides]|uniref:Dnaj protein-like protein n=1 Tax=Thalictrum thalictroides TaxID=46969 RepID=A0A7J6VPU9_THATH|nr:Dnaj protein-like protein [Thalictrum thalictroides]
MSAANMATRQKRSRDIPRLLAAISGTRHGFAPTMKFKELAQAYEVLSDPEKCELYDQYCEDALKDPEMDGEGGHDPFDIFSSFFGNSPLGGGGSSRGPTQRRGEDVVHPLEVSLEDLYSGTSKKLSLSRNVLCSKCNGEGSKSGASMKCPGCQGSGMKVSIRQLGLGMIQQMQHPCNECKGTGESINEKDRCPSCKGEKVVTEKNDFEVHIEKGMQNGQKITFPGEADEAISSKEGMPMYQRPFMRGKLYIHFTVDFPNSLTPEQCKALEAVLPPTTAVHTTDMELEKYEETTLHDVNIKELRKQAAQHEVCNEDNEMPGGA